jgi:hypothetical protein
MACVLYAACNPFSSLSNALSYFAASLSQPLKSPTRYAFYAPTSFGNVRLTFLQTSPRVRLEQIVNGSLTCRRTVHTIDDGEWLANYAFQQTGNLDWIRSR